MQKNGTIMIAGSIVLAGLIIAGAVLFTNNSGGAAVVANGAEGELTFTSLSDLGVREPSNDEHIIGDADADIVLIEYSDYECPFCSRFHPTVARLQAEYSGKVAWVYRHFPLTSIHARALPSSVASECVADLAGNDAFWTFTDALFANQGDLSDAALTRHAVAAGVAEADFGACMAAGDDSIVQEDMAEVARAGGQGTPFTIAVTKDGKAIPFSGALPYETVKGLVEQLLNI